VRPSAGRAHLDAPHRALPSATRRTGEGVVLRGAGMLR
jgi:hypothetical protein